MAPSLAGISQESFERIPVEDVGKDRRVKVVGSWKIGLLLKIGVRKDAKNPIES